MASSTENVRSHYPVRVPALRVEQPIGVFYVASLPAKLLLDVAFSDTLSARFSEGEQAYVLDGTQRLQQPKRLEQIARYINRLDASFPNAIILAANYRQEDGLLEDTDDDAVGEEGEKQVANHSTDRRWSIEERENGCCELIIPTGDKLAAIIDGQHRLFAFADANGARLEMDLVCSIFLDLPKPFQAQLFATINSTQKPVDKSLTYELFGYNIVDEDPAQWTPDKLAVFLTRRLGTDPESPLEGRIVIAPKKDAVLEKLGSGKSWKVSTAVIVEGIMRLFSSNPKRDTTDMLRDRHRSRADIENLRRDKSPLRNIYLEGNDALLYQLVLNYMKACETVFWSKATEGSFIRKTVGIQALLDVLRKLAPKVYEEKNIKVENFINLLKPAENIDFADVEFRNASGSGRSLIARTIRMRLGLDKP